MTLAITIGTLAAAISAVGAGGVVSGGLNPKQVGTLHWYGGTNTAFTNFGLALSAPAGTAPKGMAFDGSSIWVANSTSNNVKKLNIATGAVLATTAVGTSPRAIAFDGVNGIWVANFGSNNVTRINAATGVV